MNESLSQTEIAHRDTLLSKSDDESFDELCATYGWERPTWILRKHWRKALIVAMYGPRGTFHTFRAFVQAALAGYQLPLRWKYNLGENPQNAQWKQFRFQEHEYNYDLPLEPTQEEIDAGYIPRSPMSPRGRNTIRLDPPPKGSSLFEAYWEYVVLEHRDILLQGGDLNWRLHRIIYDFRKKLESVVLAKESTGYWRGFPTHTWYPFVNSKPFKKNEDEFTTPHPYAVDVTPEGYVAPHSEGSALLLPFTITERSPNINKDWPFKEGHPNAPGAPKFNPNFYAERNLIRLHLFTDLPSVYSDTPPTWLIGGSGRIVIEELKFGWDDPLSANYVNITPKQWIDMDPNTPGPTHYWYKEPLSGAYSATGVPSEIDASYGKVAGDRPAGQEYGGQMQTSEFEVGYPKDAVGGIGTQPAEETDAIGPHPPYLYGKNKDLLAQSDSFFKALLKVLPVGARLEILRSYGIEWEARYKENVDFWVVHGDKNKFDPDGVYSYTDPDAPGPVYPAPKLIESNPIEGPIGTTIQIKGENFAENFTVDFILSPDQIQGGVDYAGLNPTFINSTSIKVDVPDVPNAPAGPGTFEGPIDYIRVTNGDGKVGILSHNTVFVGAILTSVAAFTYTAP